MDSIIPMVLNPISLSTSILYLSLMYVYIWICPPCLASRSCSYHRLRINGSKKKKCGYRYACKKKVKWEDVSDPGILQSVEAAIRENRSMKRISIIVLCVSVCVKPLNEQTAQPASLLACNHLVQVKV